MPPFFVSDRWLNRHRRGYLDRCGQAVAGEPARHQSLYKRSVDSHWNRMRCDLHRVVWLLRCDKRRQVYADDGKYRKGRHFPAFALSGFLFRNRRGVMNTDTALCATLHCITDRYLIFLVLSFPRSTSSYSSAYSSFCYWAAYWAMYFGISWTSPCASRCTTR